jgi:hypothetical protein
VAKDVQARGDSLAELASKRLAASAKMWELRAELRVSRSIEMDAKARRGEGHRRPPHERERPDVEQRAELRGPTSRSRAEERLAAPA